jgi:heme a synthase
MADDGVTKPGDRQVATWLLICCALVFGMVVLGGVTRLTGSGLSMAEWKPIMGWLPPLDDAAWQRAFELYRQTPEFLKLNPHMDVQAFKGIFWLEYLHRLLGRTLALVFALPLLYFAIRRRIAPRQLPKYLLMLVLGGLQGGLGWIMVLSGMVDTPHVSHYKLVAHLVAAFLIYAYMLWTALALLQPRAGGARQPWFGRAAGLTGLISLTVISGGFVAGLRAGLIYNTFPMMGDTWIPPGLFALEPLWRNFFDNPATVQFDHRVLAITTFAVVIAFWAGSRRSTLPPRARLARNALLHTVLLQVVLGISTLLLGVPIALAAAHQAVAMLLFTVSLYLASSLR